MRRARVHVCVDVVFAVRVFVFAVAGRSSSSARTWWHVRGV